MTWPPNAPVPNLASHSRSVLLLYGPGLGHSTAMVRQSALRLHLSSATKNYLG